MTAAETASSKDAGTRSEDRPRVSRASEPRKKRGGFLKLRVLPQSIEARKLAAVVLEVLAGVRTPSEAAALVGISPPRYYALEARALEGLVGALEKRPRGPRRTLETEVARLKRDCGRLQRDSARNQALLRAAERAVGLSAQVEARGKEQPGGKKRRRRRVARALRAAAALKVEPEAISLAGPVRPGEDGASVKR